MRQKLRCLAFLLGAPLLLNAQNVGIGTNTPNASAKLEIVDANRGFLFPRVSLTATNVAAPVTTPANWLVVFNTVSAGAGATAVSPGLYYRDGTQWVRFSTTQSNDWTLLGNAGTAPATNFIGTTDAQDFVTRTNNMERMRVTSAGNVGIGANNPITGLDVRTGTNSGYTGQAIFGTSTQSGKISFRRGVDGNNGAYVGWASALDDTNFEIVNGSGSGVLRLNNAGNGGNLQFWTTHTPSTGNAERMRITDFGNVGINTTTPADRLDVNGGGWLRSTANPFYVMSHPANPAQGGFIHTQISANTAGTWGFKEYTLATGLAQNQTSFNLGLVNMGTPNSMFLDKILVAQGTGQLAMGAAVTDANAQLDIVSNARGVLLPRVALTSTASFAPLASAPTTSMLVYNTATVSDVSPGFYFWNGTNWVRFQTSNTNNWTLLGNAGTNPATNFIGTSDAQDFVARTSNTERMRITSAGNLGVGTATPNTLFQVNAGASTANMNPAAISVNRAATNVEGSLWFMTGGASRWILQQDNDNTENLRLWSSALGQFVQSWEHSTGNVGIGTGSNVPASRLQIAGGDTRIGELSNGVAAGYGRYLHFSGGGNLGTGNGDNSDPLWISRFNVSADRSELRINTGDEISTGDAFVVGAHNGSIAGSPWTPVLTANSNGNTTVHNLAGAGNRIVMADATGTLFASSVNTTAWSLLGNSATNPATNFVGTTDAQDFVTRTNNAERMRVTSAGNVGIATTAPGQRLTVNGGIQSLDYGGAGTVNVQVGDDAYFSDLDLANTIGLRTAVDFANLSLGSNNQGMVGGGTADYVHNAGTQNFGTGGRYIIAASHSSAGYTIGETGGMFADGNAVSLWSPGDANGGQPSALVYFMDEDFWDNTNTNPYDNTALKSYINGAGALVSASDMRRKNTITPITNALARIMNIGGYEYFFNLAPAEIEKGDKAPLQSGVLAQELQKEFPTAVEQSKDGKDMYVNYSAMTPYLIEAIKEQQRQIEALQKRIEDLEKRQK